MLGRLLICQGKAHKYVQYLGNPGDPGPVVFPAGEAQAILAKAEAKARAIRLLSEALAEQVKHILIASFIVASQHDCKLCVLESIHNTGF